MKKIRVTITRVQTSELIVEDSAPEGEWPHLNFEQMLELGMRAQKDSTTTNVVSEFIETVE
jgi:hypothetical protein